MLKEKSNRDAYNWTPPQAYFFSFLSSCCSTGESLSCGVCIYFYCGHMPQSCTENLQGSDKATGGDPHALNKYVTYPASCLVAFIPPPLQIPLKEQLEVSACKLGCLDGEGKGVATQGREESPIVAINLQTPGRGRKQIPPATAHRVNQPWGLLDCIALTFRPVIQYICVI